MSKGYWIGFAVGFVAAVLINVALGDAFGADFWRSVLFATVVIYVSANVGEYVGEDN